MACAFCIWGRLKAIVRGEIKYYHGICRPRYKMITLEYATGKQIVIFKFLVILDHSQLLLHQYLWDSPKKMLNRSAPPATPGTARIDMPSVRPPTEAAPVRKRTSFDLSSMLPSLHAALFLQHCAGQDGHSRSGGRRASQRCRGNSACVHDRPRHARRASQV